MENKFNVLEEAKKLHKIGKIDQAIKEYLKIINDFKNEAQVYFLIGTAFLQIKDYKKCVFYLSKAITLKKDTESYYNNIGIALSQLNNNESAIINYKKALKLNPNFPKLT